MSLFYIFNRYNVTETSIFAFFATINQKNLEIISRALKSPFSYYIIVDLVKHSFYQVNNLYFKFEPKR